MKRRDADVEAELILISEAVARLKAGMYGGLPEPKPVASIKANIKKRGSAAFDWMAAAKRGRGRVHLRNHCAGQIVQCLSCLLRPKRKRIQRLFKCRLMTFSHG